MKKIIALVGILTALIPVTAMADGDDTVPARNADQNVTEILINQPYLSKKLGDLTLPFMWEASENEQQNRLVVTETRTKAPAVLTVDLVKLPPDDDFDADAREIANELAAQLSTTAQLTKIKKSGGCQKKKCPSVDVYTAEFNGNEGQIPRKCAIQIINGGSNAVVMTLCAHAERQYSPSLSAILEQFFSMMK